MKVIPYHQTFEYEILQKGNKKVNKRKRTWKKRAKIQKSKRAMVFRYSRKISTGEV